MVAGIPAEGRVKSEGMAILEDRGMSEGRVVAGRHRGPVGTGEAGRVPR